MTPAQTTQLDDANRTIAQQSATIEQLKNDLSSAQTQCAAIEQMSADMLKLQSQVAWLSRQLFGRKSEKYALPAESGLFADLPQATPAPGSSPAPTQTITYEREVATSAVRGKRLPIPADLPRVERVHDLPADMKAGMKRIGQEVSEKIEYEPGKVYVIRDVQIKYARLDECLDGSLPNVLLAGKPDEGLSKCIAGPSLLAHIAVSKFADSLPLHRLEGILRRSGVELSRSSLCRWMQGLGELCMPLLSLMKERVLHSHVIQADETPVKQQMGGDGDGKRGGGSGGTSGGTSGGMKTCYFWSYVGDDEHPYILYDYQQSRSSAAPNRWFTDARGQPAYHGHLQCDAYAGYNALFDPQQSRGPGAWRMTHVGCWAHARRKFHDARLQSPGLCHHALAQIQSLYQIERDADAGGDRKLDAATRQTLRENHARPIIDALVAWCETQQRQALPKSGLGEALTYTLNQITSLRRYLGDGQLAIDNNQCERSIRPIAIGRKNWLFTGSPAGGKAAAAMFSLISSAKRHDVEPLAYLPDLFTRLPATPLSQLSQFLPYHWQPRHA
jgi:transposase